MKLCNISVNGETHLAIETERGMIDATAAGFLPNMDALIRSAGGEELNRIAWHLCELLEKYPQDTFLPAALELVGTVLCKPSGRLRRR